MMFGRARQVPATCYLVGVLVAVGHQVALGATLPFPTATQRLTGPSFPLGDSNLSACFTKTRSTCV